MIQQLENNRQIKAPTAFQTSSRGEPTGDRKLI